jgi:hypothetical protein
MQVEIYKKIDVRVTIQDDDSISDIIEGLEELQNDELYRVRTAGETFVMEFEGESSE